MMNKILLSSLPLAILFFAACARLPRTAAQENPQTPGINQKNEARKIEKYVNLFDYRQINDRLTEKNFTVERRFKTHADSIDRKPSVEFAVLRKSGKTVMNFDRLDSSLSSADFGLFGFLGGKEKQLFVSQTAPRSGVHWIVETKPPFRALFFNADWSVGREDFNALDLDADGVYELSFESTSFYGFESKRLGNVGVPLTEIVFKYDAGAEKFFPANPQFSDFALREIADEISRVRRDNKDLQLADVLKIVLRRIYAGRETEAWEFFDRNYDFDDREDLKTKIKAILQTDAVYQYIYRQN